MKMSFRDLIEFLFLPVMTAGVIVLWDLNKNVNNLNVQVGIVIAQGAAAKERIESLEKRLEKLEDKKGQ